MFAIHDKVDVKRMNSIHARKNRYYVLVTDVGESIIAYMNERVCAITQLAEHLFYLHRNTYSTNT